MQILQNEKLAKYTTFKIGGPVDKMVIPEKVEELLTYLKNNPQRSSTIILGMGSNILAADEGTKTTVIKITFDKIKIIAGTAKVKVEAGCPLPLLARWLLKNGLTGLEFVCGIPGTVGGAVAMNAGVGDHRVAECVDKIYCLDYSGKAVVVKKNNAAFGYRESIFQKKQLIITAVDFILKKANKTSIKKRMNEFIGKRNKTQPLKSPSAGSIFKNPALAPAAKLIDEAGCKGLKVGAAAVSSKHAGFIINKGKAKAREVLALIDLIKQKVRGKFGVDLELEIKLII